MHESSTHAFVHVVCVFCFLSSLVWFFLWLPEEVLTLFLLHRGNGDFSFLMKDILFMWENFTSFTHAISFLLMCSYMFYVLSFGNFQQQNYPGSPHSHASIVQALKAAVQVV
jgi:hypothetical protein